MIGRLLDRQARLLEYLTSGRAIFGEPSTSTLDPALRGMERGLLDLEARFSHEKRMEKIAAVFPTTFALLGADSAPLIRAFAEACPPRDISRIDNARQFHGFVTELWQRQPAPRPDLSDAVAFELACAEARMRADADGGPEPTERPAIRRSQNLILLRTAFDIGLVFERNSPPVERNTLLAIAWRSGEPQMQKLPAEIFNLLAALEHWTALADLQGAEELVAELVPAGLLELRR